MEAKKGKRKKRNRLVLDRQHLIGMLSDPDFYEQCPFFLWLRKSAMVAYEAYLASATCCGGDWSIMRPTVDAFFANLKELDELNPEYVECVRDYLEGKKGYRPDPIIIMYRAQKSGRPAKLVI